MKMKFFDLCKELKKHSNHKQHKMSSVIVRKNRVIGTGFNQLKTHSLSKHPFKSLHAEVHAVLKTTNKEDLEGAEIYIYRENRYGLPALAKPCPYCLALLKEVGIKRMHYSNNLFCYTSDNI